MNRNILGFCFGAILWASLPVYAQQTATSTAKSKPEYGRVAQASADAVGSPAVAQAGDSVAETTSSSETGKNEVKDYASFKKHVENEYKKLKVIPTTIETGPVRNVLRKKGIELSSATIWATSKDGFRHAWQSPDNKGVAVIDGKSRQIEIYNATGELRRKIPFSKYPDGSLAFSDTRLFIVKPCLSYDLGFEIYNSSGTLIKDYKEECVDGYLVSNNQKYFAVIAGAPNTGNYFVLYDMEGNELWRQSIVLGGNVKSLQFSLDDRFAILKMPIYWEGTGNQFRHERKVYLLDIENRRLMSEENYEK